MGTTGKQIGTGIETEEETKTEKKREVMIEAKNEIEAKNVKETRKGTEIKTEKKTGVGRGTVSVKKKEIAPKTGIGKEKGIEKGEKETRAGIKKDQGTKEKIMTKIKTG